MHIYLAPKLLNIYFASQKLKFIDRIKSVSCLMFLRFNQTKMCVFYAAMSTCFTRVRCCELVILTKQCTLLISKCDSSKKTNKTVINQKTNIMGIIVA